MIKIIDSKIRLRSSLGAQQVNDTALSLPWLRSLMRHGFDIWPRNFHMLWMQPLKKKMMILGISVRLTFEWANWVKLIALPNLGGPHPIRWRPNREKKLNFRWIRENSSCLMAFEVGHWLFFFFSSFFWTWTEILAHPESQACWLQPHHCSSWVSSLPTADLETCQTPKSFEPIPYNKSLYTFTYTYTHTYICIIYVRYVDIDIHI